MIDRATLKAIPWVYRSYQLYRYLAFQPRLAAANLRDWLDSARSASAPVPPAKLRYRVHGGLDREGFLRNGRVIAANLREILASAGRELDSFERVLDFGCGSGRVIRNLVDGAEPGRFHGTDIDPELVDWCARNLSGVQWRRNDFEPPLDYPDESFDLVYAVSVFTHLDEALQLAWLEELHRIVRPDGILLLTVHGESIYGTLAPAVREAIRARGFLFLRGATGRLKLDGLPDFYQSAYHSRDYVRDRWSRWFEVVRYVERGINDHQDAVVLRRREATAADGGGDVAAGPFDGERYG